MKQVLSFVGAILLSFLLLPGLFACRAKRAYEASATAVAVSPDGKLSQVKTHRIKTSIGFRSRRLLEEHYKKHGREFGSISQEEYLLQAQTLRDASAGGDILEAKRSDGTISRFDRKTGTFLAFNDDLTIRTCFKPNDGERYFHRQLKRR